ncbi:MAG: hypothetical protein ACLQVY_31145 [Limisphaerales bacterium]
MLTVIWVGTQPGFDQGPHIGKGSLLPLKFEQAVWCCEAYLLEVVKPYEID